MKLNGITEYHAKYLAAKIRRRFPMDDFNRLTNAIYDSNIEIYPHQLSAADFVLNSPLSKGAILADEIGMGKSVETGLVLSNLKNHGEKKFLIIAPVTEITMWKVNLQRLFGFESMVITERKLVELKKLDNANPLDVDPIVICSYKFAYERMNLLEKVEWEFIVVDEAHRLKNIYDIRSAIGDSISFFVKPYPKLLITSNPFQSTMKRLFRLGNLVDKYAFGDKRSFNYQFVSITDDIDYGELSKRLRPVMIRTPHHRAKDYIGKAFRREILLSYKPSALESDFITAVNNYFINTSKFGLPSEKESLQALALYKQLVVSPKIAMGGLGYIDAALKIVRQAKDPSTSLIRKFKNDIETLSWIDDEWYRKKDGGKLDATSKKNIKRAVDKEQNDLLIMREYALSIKKDSRINALVNGLNKAERSLKRKSGRKHYIIYTESKQAQKYIAFMLHDRGFSNIYTINKRNQDKRSLEIYHRFINNKENHYLLTGDELIDRRTAIINEFQSKGEYLVATDPGMSEQVLKKCDVVVNYDLPIDPYRTEWRISRVSGQFNNNDILVLNIVNEANEFEKWNYQIQSENFEIFSGKHGRSDRAIGSIGVGTDYAMEVFKFFMQTHTVHLMDQPFRKISVEIKDAVSRSMNNYYNRLVIKSAQTEKRLTKKILDRYDESITELKKSLTIISAVVVGDKGTVTTRGAGYLNLRRKPLVMKKEDLGIYGFDETLRGDRRKFYVNKGIGKKILDKAYRGKLPVHHLKFRYASVKPRFDSLKKLKKSRGFLELKLVTVRGMQIEDYLIFNAITDDGQILSQKQCHDLMHLSAKDLGGFRGRIDLRKVFLHNKEQLIKKLQERDTIYMEELSRKLEIWLNDRVLVHRRDLRLIMTEKRKLHRRWMNSTRERRKEKLEMQLLEVGVLRRKKMRYIRKIRNYSTLEKDDMLGRL